MVKSKRALIVQRATSPAPVMQGPAERRADPAQDNLFTDPMPRRVEPCLAKLATSPPATGSWSYEVKWDGYRLAVHIEADGQVRLLTRNGHNWTHRFPKIAAAAGKLSATSAILDGEAVVLNDRGISDFNALQNALGGRGGRRDAEAVILYAFDLLYLDGKDLRSQPLSERRAQLGSLIQKAAPTILLSEEVVADGATFLRLACSMELEGIIAKRRSSPYRSGRGGEWLKIKCVSSETFVIIGYQPSASAIGGIARLFLAAHRNGELHSVGSVGTGFTRKSAEALKAHLTTIERSTPALKSRRKAARWVQPTLLAEIEFRGWTSDGKLRHASFKGLRDEAEGQRVLQLAE